MNEYLNGPPNSARDPQVRRASGCEEVEEDHRELAGCFLGHVVAAIDCLPLHIVGPRTPD